MFSHIRVHSLFSPSFIIKTSYAFDFNVKGHVPKILYPVFKFDFKDEINP